MKKSRLEDGKKGDKNRTEIPKDEYETSGRESAKKIPETRGNWEAELN